jgi:hypothetical protein
MPGPRVIFQNETLFPILVGSIGRRIGGAKLVDLPEMHDWIEFRDP